MAIGTPYAIGAGTASAATSVLITAGHNAAVGDAVFVALYIPGTQVSGLALTDSSNNTYTILTSNLTASGSFAVAWSALNHAISASITTMSWSWTTAANAIMGAFGCSLGGTATLDQSGTINTGAASPATPGSITTTQAVALAINWVGFARTSGNPTTPVGWTAGEQDITSPAEINGFYQVQSSTGTLTPSTAHTGTISAWQDWAGDFYPAGAPAGIPGELAMLGAGTT